MARRFTRFILLAEMRTGSNFLEENLNSVDGLQCWGEAFNPGFVGHRNKDQMAGITLAQREANPMGLLAAMQDRTDGLSGFRFFSTHDPRVLQHCLADQACAKIILTRNPVDSFVSLAIARETDQWRMRDIRKAKTAKITFDPVAFTDYLNRLTQFQRHVQKTLQLSGQTGFYLSYEDVSDLGVLNGLLDYLGVDGRLTKLSDRIKVQNPAGLEDKVANYDEMVASLGSIDYFGLDQTPNFEPQRGPNVPSFVAAARTGLLYMPIKGGPVARVTQWLADIDGQETVYGMTQKEIRRWKRQRPQHRSFTIVRHPVDRAHDAFVRHILMPGPSCFAEIRQSLRGHFGVSLPQEAPGPDWDAAAHRTAFLQFLGFLKGNLRGQTSLRVDPSWASQSSILQGIAGFMSPDLVIREADMIPTLDTLAAGLGQAAPWTPEEAHGPITLDAVYDPDIENAVRDTYQRDYMMFGFQARGATA